MYTTQEADSTLKNINIYLKIEEITDTTSADFFDEQILRQEMQNGYHEITFSWWCF